MDGRRARRPVTVTSFPDVEVVTEKTERYWLVTKIAEAGEIAKEHDPRGG
jgi:hypothetical protein